MAGGKQHVEMFRKIGLRRALLKLALPGPAYVPYIGDADIASELYLDRKVYGADIDPERVATARPRLPDADVKVADCDKTWPFAGVDEPFAVADLDSYADPYQSFKQFWTNAQKLDRLVVFFTDGHRQAIMRSRILIDPDGNHSTLPDITASRHLYNMYWSEWIEPWFSKFLAEQGWHIVKESHYLRRDMFYWGAVIEKGATPKAAAKKAAAKKRRLKIVRIGKKDKPQIDIDDALLGAEDEDDEDTEFTDEQLGINPLRIGKFGPRKKRAYLAALSEGASRTAGAAQVGVTLRTVEKHAQKFPGFAEAMDLAEMNADGAVENALFQAAQSGNVTAIQVWLYNRASDRWSDRRNRDTKLEMDGAAIDLIADIISKNVTDEETLSRIRAELAGLATPREAAGPAADTAGAV